MECGVDQHVSLVIIVDEICKEGGRSFVGGTGSHSPAAVLRLQRWPILPYLHSRRHSSDLRLRPHRHKDPQEQVSHRPLPGNLHLLRRHLPGAVLPLHDLQGTWQYTQGYLPNDTTGNFVFKVQESLALFLSGYILYCITVTFRTSYNYDLDTVKSYYLIGAAAVLAILFHSSLNRSFFGDYFWAFSQYLQTFAILSQFVLFRNKKGDIESYTSHFVAAQGISRILFIIFWIFTYAELNTENAMSLLSEYVGYWFMASQIIHLFIMGDFMYYWFKAIRHGTGVIQLPTYI